MKERLIGVSETQHQVMGREVTPAKHMLFLIGEQTKRLLLSHILVQSYQRRKLFRSSRAGILGGGTESLIISSFYFLVFLYFEINHISTREYFCSVCKNTPWNLLYISGLMF